MKMRTKSVFSGTALLLLLLVGLGLTVDVEGFNTYWGACRQQPRPQIRADLGLAPTPSSVMRGSAAVTTPTWRCSRANRSLPSRPVAESAPERRGFSIGTRPSHTWKRRLTVAAILCLTIGVLSKVPVASAATMATNTPSLSPILSRRDELRLMGRLWYAATLGAAVGKERSTGNHHPAGVRTMALVSLGSAGFTLCSLYGFGPPGRYDVSRMASAVASGIGFIGAGVITTTTSNIKSADANDEQSLLMSNESCVHGLTTAAAVWISAAVGVTCATGLYILATSLAAATLGFLRVGGAAKRQSLQRQYQDLARQIEAKPELLRYYLMNRSNVSLPTETREREDRNQAGITPTKDRQDQGQAFETSRSQQATPPVEYNDLDFPRELSYSNDTMVSPGSTQSRESFYKSHKLRSEEREHEQPLDNASLQPTESRDNKPQRTKKLQSSDREKPVSFADKTTDAVSQEISREMRHRRSRFEDDDDKPAP